MSLWSYYGAFRWLPVGGLVDALRTCLDGFDRAMDPAAGRHFDADRVLRWAYRKSNGNAAGKVFFSSLFGTGLGAFAMLPLTVLLVYRSENWPNRLDWSTGQPFRVMLTQRWLPAACWLSG